MKGIVLCVILQLILLPAFAQWDVPVYIELTGPEPSDRQITGLADPNSPDAAVSLDAARAASMSYATASGTMAMQAALYPTPLAYTAGMVVTIVPDQANEASPTIELNGLGPVPIIKWGGHPLDSADLQAGVPARLIYDGSNFLLMSATYVPCPAGYSAIGTKFCINDTVQAFGNFFNAVAYCNERNASLCTFNEWLQACRNTTWFSATVGVGEWVDHAANNLNDAKVLGAGDTGDSNTPSTGPCDRGSSTLPTVQGRGIRCCRNR